LRSALWPNCSPIKASTGPRSAGRLLGTTNPLRRYTSDPWRSSAARLLEFRGPVPPSPSRATAVRYPAAAPPSAATPYPSRIGRSQNYRPALQHRTLAPQFLGDRRHRPTDLHWESRTSVNATFFGKLSSNEGGLPCARAGSRSNRSWQSSSRWRWAFRSRPGHRAAQARMRSHPIN